MYAVVGLGYVGLGLAVALGKSHRVFGVDIDESRIHELKQNIDRTYEVSSEELQASRVLYTSDLAEADLANFYIVSVSTPAYYYSWPNLEPLIHVTQMLGKVLKKGDIVVYESTVYPGTTEQVCIPLLEEHSKLQCGKDFHVGYSPERINPGDKVHTLHTIPKIISAQNHETLQALRETYESICTTVYPVSSIPTAEAIKVLENTQRDVNIAMMNEFTQIMHALHLNTHEIIEGAKTKWSFMPYKPGLVGGHCISIDPHYLAFQAKRHGIAPDLILKARAVNDAVTPFILQQMVQFILTHFSKKHALKNVTIGVFGITYKENTPDIRNSLALKFIKELHEYGLTCRVHDPFYHGELMQSYGSLTLENFDDLESLSIVVLLVGHDFYRDLGLKKMLRGCKKQVLLMDVPHLFIDDHDRDSDLMYWSL